MPVSHSNRGVVYVKGDEIILVIIYHFRVFAELSISLMDSENAPFNLTFDCNACISTSVFILREKLEPSCARFHALYKHFDLVFSKTTLTEGPRFRKSLQRKPKDDVKCDELPGGGDKVNTFYHGQCERDCRFT